jgi:hypothetical protein
MHTFVSLACLGLFSVPLPGELSGKVEVKVVKMDELRRAIQRHEGRPVILYFWGSYSIPDTKELPQFVALQARYRGKVAAISASVDPVSVDPETNDRRRAIILKLLERHRARFENVILDEETEDWMRKFLVIAPAVVVFDSTGKQVGAFDLFDLTKSDSDILGQAETLIRKLLEQK